MNLKETLFPHGTLNVFSLAASSCCGLSVDIGGANDTTYTISNIQTSHQGNYDVVVSNSAGPVTSSSASLVVIQPPVITSHPSSLELTAGASASFSVSANGTAPLSYQWFKDGSEISGATLSSFSIGNVQVSNAGSYHVRVSNAAGSVNSNPATLKVIAVATQRPFLKNPTWSSTTGFKAILEGEAQMPYTVQWSTNGIQWKVLTSFVSEGLSTVIQDPEAANESMRVYRVVSP